MDFKRRASRRAGARGVSAGNRGANARRTLAMSVYSSASAPSGSAACLARQSATTSATVASAGKSAPKSASKGSSASCSSVGEGARAEGVFLRMLLCADGADGSAASATSGSAAGISTSAAGPRERALLLGAMARCESRCRSGRRALVGGERTPESAGRDARPRALSALRPLGSTRADDTTLATTARGAVRCAQRLRSGNLRF